MANDWTRLLQETSKRGGPDGLKAFYENRGKLEGAGAMLFLAAGVALLVKAHRSFTQAKEVDVPTQAPDESEFDDGTSKNEAPRKGDEPDEETPAEGDRLE